MTISFEIVKIYYGDIYTGYWTKPIENYELYPGNDWTEGYALKINGEYFLLGKVGEGVYVSEQ